MDELINNYLKSKKLLVDSLKPQSKESQISWKARLSEIKNIDPHIAECAYTKFETTWSDPPPYSLLASNYSVDEFRLPSSDEDWKLIYSELEATLLLEKFKRYEIDYWFHKVKMRVDNGATERLDFCDILNFTTSALILIARDILANCIPIRIRHFFNKDIRFGKKDDFPEDFDPNFNPKEENNNASQ